MPEQAEALHTRVAILAEKGSRVGAAARMLAEHLIRAADGKPDEKDRLRWGVELLDHLKAGLDGYSATPAQKIVTAVRKRLTTDRDLDLHDLGVWLDAHREDHPEHTVECIDVRPPDNVTVLKVLSIAGSQKIVFHARWAVTEREIVLKSLRDFPGKESVLARELQPHPLSMEHPNIIETHLLKNNAGEEFLAERYLQALSDGWRSDGAFEAANLLHDIASALQFVHDRQRIHGDVKPDNVGYYASRYILLDFGVCRPAADFDQNGSPTGSLRTRAPELLVRTGTHSEASDVWALGATVFNVLIGRFPLYKRGDPTPRPWDLEKRDQYESLLRERAQDAYDEKVLDELDRTPHDELGRVLRRALEREPGDRPSAGELAAVCRSSLASLVRGTKMETLSAADRAEQLIEMLPDDPDLLRLLTNSKRRALRSEVENLIRFPGLNKGLQKQLGDVAERIPSEGR